MNAGALYSLAEYAYNIPSTSVKLSIHMYIFS